MRDVQKMPSREDASCEEEDDMNFAFTTAGGAGQFISAQQLPKMQQQVTNNGATLQQVVGMVGSDGNVQYMRAVDAGLQAAPQLITLPIALPGAKPGDPQQTVQIQVLGPNLIQQQQPKFQMQIPIQGFQQGGAVLTLAYSPEGNDGMQLLGNSLPEGFQVVTALPQEVMMPDTKDTVQHMLQQQAFTIQTQQLATDDNNKLNNNTSNNNHNSVQHIIIKEECDDTNDDSSQGTSGADEQGQAAWQAAAGASQDLVNYLNKLPQQHTQALPVSLQQFLVLNSGAAPAEPKEDRDVEIEIEMPEGADQNEDEVESEQPAKKKKKYKKKSPKPAKPKPGQVIITVGDDGSPLYCCPECQLAYSDKDQLEMHLSVHKIERRFICGICGAGLKRKEHLERHKLGHNNERPYVCAVCRKGFKRREHLNLHTVIHSGVKTELCLECGKGFYRKDHLRKHARSHETRRARAEYMNRDYDDKAAAIANIAAAAAAASRRADTAEITIHVPTSANVQVPVQINIPQHVVSSLTAAQAAQVAALASAPAPAPALVPAPATSPAASTSPLDALLAQHS